ncbi:ABC transporter ATP-binding protein [Winogradskyella maritima]|uniref:ATP-binding cassette domain-containing protein n=1 Tax=Winogradskyella maritima TaxID=1517766 RepID=A0ABV8AJ13_9FLAO|nr:ABC transporter ATP-binding protein [Winogradskyella maritima]
MKLIDQRITETKDYLDNGDLDLGFRRLMDLAMDTDNMDVYQSIINLTEWKSNHQNQDESFTTKAKSILDTIAKQTITVGDRSQVIVKAEDVCKSYGKNKFALGPVSLGLQRGKVYGLVGENGNGKTTLLRILARELSKDSGTLYYNINETVLSDYDLRTRLVYIPQRTKKWYGSLQDNLKFVLSSYGLPPEEIDQRVLMMIARFGLWNYKDLKWNELSSGYKMRFELARTMLRQPEVLLLDEPLANLDIMAQQVILEDLKSLCNSVRRPVALILSSQQLYEVEKVSDMVIFLKNGQYRDNLPTQVDDRGRLTVEIDTEATRAELLDALGALQIESLTFNGGLYIANFKDIESFSAVLSYLGQAHIKILYIRDITQSTRRFFVS